MHALSSTNAVQLGHRGIYLEINEDSQHEGCRLIRKKGKSAKFLSHVGEQLILEAAAAAACGQRRAEIQ